MKDSELARLSSLIYHHPDDFENQAAAHGWKLSHWLDDRGTQAAIVMRDDESEAVLIFRGTQVTDGKLRQRLADLKTNLKMWRRGRYHAGYYEAVSWLATKAHARAKHLSVPLYTTGHSLGGALATIYACEAKHDIEALVTFGAPKAVIDPAFAGKTVTRRYRLLLDPATLWPPLPVYSHPAPAIQPSTRMGHDVNDYWKAVTIDEVSSERFGQPA